MTPQGLTTRLADLTSHRAGFMTASAHNGFAQMVFAPDPSTQCTSAPYTFRPMYSTSSLQTRASWHLLPGRLAERAAEPAHAGNVQQRADRPPVQHHYQRVALAAPLPFNEAGGGNQPCDIHARTGCTHIPVTDDGTPAAFYPYFFTTRTNGCTWGEGQDIPGLTVNDFGKQDQYGRYDRGVYYTGSGGTPESFWTVFLHTFRSNVCPASTGH